MVAAEFPRDQLRYPPKICSKVAQVIHQLERGEAQIIFDAALKGVDIVIPARKAGRA